MLISFSKQDEEELVNLLDSVTLDKNGGNDEALQLLTIKNSVGFRTRVEEQLKWLQNTVDLLPESKYIHKEC